MAIITDAELASYLEVPITAALTLKVSLANGLIEELPYVTIPDPWPTRARSIALEVAARAVRNPDGKSTEQIDDYKFTRDKDTRQAGVYLTADERAELLGLGGVRARGFLSVAVANPLDIP
jgi:hypothetical protein